MSSCGCYTSGNEVCTTVYGVLSPCACDEAAPIRVEGPDGQDGSKGATPIFSIGTVVAGNAGVTIVVTDDINRVMNWSLPAVPEGEAYDWSEVNTFEQPSIFELGLVTTGGTTTFGGTNFAVTPNATFSGDVHVASNSEIEGDVTVTANLNEDNDITVVGSATFDDIEFRGSNDLTETTFSLDNASGYVAGVLNLASCLDMERQPNVGSGVYAKALATGLTPVGPVSSGAICATIVVNVPVSACLPQVTPKIDFLVRISYTLNSALFFNYFTATLWQGSIGTGTELDFYTLGDPAYFNDEIGFFFLRGQATLAVGNNNFLIEVTNPDAVGSFEPTYVEYSYKN